MVKRDYLYNSVQNLKTKSIFEIHINKCHVVQTFSIAENITTYWFRAEVFQRLLGPLLFSLLYYDL